MRRTRRTMWRLLTGLICVLVLTLWRLSQQPNMPAAERWSGRCVAVADGDTISVMRGRTSVKVRLNGVDCPEKGQAFGSVAKQFSSRAVFGTEVEVVPTDTDRYGRTVGDVLTADGKSLNEALVGAGLAWWYRRYAPNNNRLRALEEQARKAHRGLWADPHPEAPWDYRTRARMGK